MQQHTSLESAKFLSSAQCLAHRMVSMLNFLQLKHVYDIVGQRVQCIVRAPRNPRLLM